MKLLVVLAGLFFCQTALGQIFEYRQMYSGIFVRPISWTPVGVGAGIDQADSKARLGTFYRNYFRNYSSQGVQENNGAIPWRMYTTDARITDSVSAGIHVQTFMGIGPRFRYKLKNKFRFISALQSIVTRDKKGRFTVLVGMHVTYPSEY